MPYYDTAQRYQGGLKNNTGPKGIFRSPEQPAYNPLGRSQGSPVLEKQGAPPLNPYTHINTRRSHSGRETAAQQEVGYLRPQTEQRQHRANWLTGKADEALLDPEGTIGRFKDLYAEYANAWAAPQQREFLSGVQGIAANVASRFGGNASSEETRVVGNAADSFSRGLTEGIARLAPEAGQMGLGYAGQLQDAAGGAQRGADTSEDQILQAIALLREKKGGSFLGSALGTAAGVALKGATGGIG